MGYRLLSNILFLIAISVSTASAQIGKSAISGAAYVWPYESLCALPEPPKPPAEVRFAKDTSLHFKGCHDLQTEWGRPTALRLHFANSGEAKTEVHIKGLTSIFIKGKPTSTALGLQVKVSIPTPFPRTTNEIANKIDGEVAFTIPPGGAIDLVVLFNSASPGDLVVVGEMEPIKISK